MDSFFYGHRAGHPPYYPDPMAYAGRAPVVELLVPMCCNKCQEKVYKAMMELRGVQGVMVDREAQRVVVHGFVDPLKALKRAKKVKRDSQIWSGDQYGRLGGRDFFSSSKYRRSAYQSPSMYRGSSYDYQPSMYRAASYEYRQPSVYRSSYNQYTPSYGGMGYMRQQPLLPVYDDMYSHVVTNPYYLKHIESEYY